jgi:transcriptional regulator with XRE-family HTH domain
MTQASLANRAGISRQRLSDLELGHGQAAPAEVWFSLAAALGRYLKFEFARDPLQELADAGHLDIQELVMKLAAKAGWQQFFEARSRAYGSDRSIDVRLVNRHERRLVIAECWNTFGDLGNATRSSDRKLRDAEEHAVAIAGEGDPFEVGLLWVVRDTRRNREIVAKYEYIFSSRFTGSSQGWVDAITTGTNPPAQPGLIWASSAATRLFAHRRRRSDAAR